MMAQLTSAMSARVPLAPLLTLSPASLLSPELLVACFVDIVIKGYVSTSAVIPAAAPDTPSMTASEGGIVKS